MASDLEGVFNGLSPAEAERLAILAEEAGEIVQIVMKALRHGLDFHHPDTGETNRLAIAREIGDLNAVVWRLVSAGDLDSGVMADSAERKNAKLPQWTHHQPDSAYGVKPGPARAKAATP